MFSVPVDIDRHLTPQTARRTLRFVLLSNHNKLKLGGGTGWGEWKKTLWTYSRFFFLYDKWMDLFFLLLLPLYLRMWLVFSQQLLKGNYNLMQYRKVVCLQYPADDSVIKHTGSNLRVCADSASVCAGMHMCRRVCCPYMHVCSPICDHLCVCVGWGQAAGATFSFSLRSRRSLEQRSLILSTGACGLEACCCLLACPPLCSCRPASIKVLLLSCFSPS